MPDDPAIPSGTANTLAIPAGIGALVGSGWETQPIRAQ
jgi:hypothetical protein